MNIDQYMLVSYDTFNSCCAKRQKTAFILMDFLLLRRKHIFGKGLKSSLSLFVPSFRFFNI